MAAPRQLRVVGSLVLDERVRQPDFDERLPGDTESPGLPIDLSQEVNREVNVACEGLGEISKNKPIYAASRMSQGRKSFTVEFHRLSRAAGPGLQLRKSSSVVSQSFRWFPV